jgi:subtilisin family serine protease
VPFDRPAPAVPQLRGVRVAVIDSGVHPDHPHVLGVAGGVAITADGEHDDFVDRIGHGTAVAAAIREKAPEANLFAVRIFDRTLAGSLSNLLRGVDWAIEQGCHVINLSLGTTRVEHESRLCAAVDRARAAGAVLVAAREDGGQRFLPGSLPGVIGVMVDWDCPRDQVRAERLGSGQILCRASGYPREIPGVSPARNLMGVSFAVANTTGVIARMLARGMHNRSRDLPAWIDRALIDNPLIPA